MREPNQKPDTEYYREKIQEMLTVPQFRGNRFLQSVLAFIDENDRITNLQAKVVDEMDEE